MNKTQFIASLAPHFNGSKKEAAHAVEIVFDSIVRNYPDQGEQEGSLPPS
jgi:DNA-binding protein HU-beta